MSKNFYDVHRHSDVDEELKQFKKKREEKKEQKKMRKKLRQEKKLRRKEHEANRLRKIGYKTKRQMKTDSGYEAGHKRFLTDPNTMSRIKGQNLPDFDKYGNPVRERAGDGVTTLGTAWGIRRGYISKGDLATLKAKYENLLNPTKPQFRKKLGGIRRKKP